MGRRRRPVAAGRRRRAGSGLDRLPGAAVGPPPGHGAAPAGLPLRPVGGAEARAGRDGRERSGRPGNCFARCASPPARQFKGITNHPLE